MAPTRHLPVTCAWTCPGTAALSPKATPPPGRAGVFSVRNVSPVGLLSRFLLVMSPGSFTGLAPGERRLRPASADRSGLPPLASTGASSGTCPAPCCAHFRGTVACAVTVTTKDVMLQCELLAGAGTCPSLSLGIHTARTTAVTRRARHPSAADRPSTSLSNICSQAA